MEIVAFLRGIKGPIKAFLRSYRFWQTEWPSQLYLRCHRFAFSNCWVNFHCFIV